MDDDSRERTLARFWAKVNKTDTCWLWTGTIDWCGYGQFGVFIDGVHKWKRAHRIAYEGVVGPIPTGLTIDHLCNVRLCVNPSHLKPATQRENLLRSDGVTAINARKTHCIHGHEFNGKNTYVYQRDGFSRRACILCGNTRRNARRALARARGDIHAH